MKQSDITLLTPYFEFFKDDVDLEIKGQALVARINGLKISFQIVVSEGIRLATPEEIQSVEGILSLDEHPKGSFDFEIRYEDGEKAEWEYKDGDRCPFYHAVRRSFPNLTFKQVSASYVRLFNHTSIARLAEVFNVEHMGVIEKTKQPFKTTITFL